MKCKKKEKRTMFSLFDEYNCEDCKYSVNNEEIKIGYDSIKIYYMGSCLIRYNETIDNRRACLLLKDICKVELIDSDDYVFLWLNYKDDLKDYYDYFEDILKWGKKIIIIC